MKFKKLFHEIYAKSEKNAEKKNLLWIFKKNGNIPEFFDHFVEDVWNGHCLTIDCFEIIRRYEIYYLSRNGLNEYMKKKKKWNWLNGLFKESIAHIQVNKSFVSPSGLVVADYFLIQCIGLKAFYQRKRLRSLNSTLSGENDSVANMCAFLPKKQKQKNTKQQVTGKPANIPTQSTTTFIRLKLYTE